VLRILNSNVHQRRDFRVADPGCLSQIPNVFHPRSEFFPSRITDPHQRIYAISPNLSSQKYDPDCSSRIRILIFSPIPDPGVKKAPDHGSATLLDLRPEVLSYGSGYIRLWILSVFYHGCALKLFLKGESPVCFSTIKATFIRF
jgi:hypothetical protein